MTGITDSLMTDEGNMQEKPRFDVRGGFRAKAGYGSAGRLGFHPVAGMVLAVAFILLCAGIAGNGIGNGPLRWDADILHAMQNRRSAALDEVMLFFTTLGNWQTVMWGMICAVVILSLKKSRRAIIALVVSVVGGALFVASMKEIVRRPRPPVDLALTHAWGFSFPSGHGFAAFSFYGLIAYFIFRSLSSAAARLFVFLTGIALVVGIETSRVYLGVHWLSDMIASCITGIVWLAAVIVMMESQSDNARRMHPAGRGAVFACWMCFIMWLGYAAVSTHRQHIEPTHMGKPVHEGVQRGG